MKKKLGVGGKKKAAKKKVNDKFDQFEICLPKEKSEKELITKKVSKMTI